jgi:hypothetical protein
VAFVGSVVRKTSSTATIVGCVSTGLCTTITTAKVESTSQTARFVRSSCLAPEVPLTKCPVVMQFTGNASASWQLTTRDALFVRRRQKRKRE